MDVIALTEHLLKNIRQQKEDYTTMLANGAVEDMENYRFVVGQIRGLTYCEEEIRAAMKVSLKMAKKLFVPERVAANMKSDTPQTKIPTAIEKALPEQEENKNTENPENMDVSALERLPNPVGYRLW